MPTKTKKDDVKQTKGGKMVTTKPVIKNEEPVKTSPVLSARNIEYSDEVIATIGEKLNELVDILPEVGIKINNSKKTARFVIATHWVLIKKILSKGYSRKYVCDFLNENKLMDVQLFTFNNIVKALIKKDTEAAAKLNLEMEIQGQASIPDELKPDINESELNEINELINDYDITHELLDETVVNA